MDVNHTIQSKLKPLSHDAIGKKMVSKVLTADKNQTVEDVRELVAREARDKELISYIYITTGKGHIKGVVSLHELFSKPLDKKISEVMATTVHKVHINTDQEKVAHIALKNQLKAVPIVDDKDKLIGAVKTDQILQILDQESQEDVLRMAGFVIGSRKHYAEDNAPFYESFFRRVPWILLGLLGGTLTASVIHSFSHVLEEDLALAGFIPLVAYVTNAVGNQTQMIFIRDLATSREFSYFRYTVRQVFISILIALACWLSVYTMSLFIWGSTRTGHIVGISIVAAILVATFFSLLIPATLKRLKLDPAVGSGPFTTIIQDLLSVIIYFTIASTLL